MRLKEPRLHDEEFLGRIRKLPCLMPNCLAPKTEAAHIRMTRAKHDGSGAGIGQKPHDCWVVPLCAWHHRTSPTSEHAVGSDGFWKKTGMDPHLVAVRLYGIHRRIRQDMEAIEAMRHVILEERFSAG